VLPVVIGATRSLSRSMRALLLLSFFGRFFLAAGLPASEGCSVSLLSADIEAPGEFFEFLLLGPAFSFWGAYLFLLAFHSPFDAACAIRFTKLLQLPLSSVPPSSEAPWRHGLPQSPPGFRSSPFQGVEDICGFFFFGSPFWEALLPGVVFGISGGLLVRAFSSSSLRPFPSILRDGPGVNSVLR